MKKERGDHFYNLFEEEHVKVKELIVNPGKEMGFQRHFKEKRNMDGQQRFMYCQL